MTESVSTRCVAGLIVCLLLGGCTGASRIPEDSFYRLQHLAPAKKLAAPVLDGTLAVQGGTAAPIYRDRALLYSEPQAPGRLQRYHYQYWIDTPPQLLQRSLADYLSEAGVASKVVLPEDGVAARYRLRVDIERFEQVRGPGNGKVVVMLRVVLSERIGGALLVQERVSAEAAITAGDFPAVAAAFERALTDVYGQIVTQLRGLP